MPTRIERLRLWFALSALVLIFIFVGVFFYARYRARRIIRDIPKQLGVDIERSTDAFTFSKAEGGKTLFTIHAAKAVQFKQGGKAAFHDVNVVVYGKQSNRYDQIYGADFEYDPQAQQISANGEVHIDIGGTSAQPINPAAPPEEMENPVHLKTSGLVFDMKSGIAQTSEAIDFRIPEGNGSAVGAEYDSKANRLTLKSKVHVESTGARAATVDAKDAVFTREPYQAVLSEASLAEKGKTVRTGEITVRFRDDNSVAQVLAGRGIEASLSGPSPTQIRASNAMFDVGEHNLLHSGTVSGNVTAHATGANAFDASAGKLLLEFTGKDQLHLVRARDGVKLNQISPQSRQAIALKADAADVTFSAAGKPQSAETIGRGDIQIADSRSDSKEAETTITADKLTAAFDSAGHLRSLHGAPEAKLLASSPGQPDRTSSSRELDVRFSAAKQGSLEEIQQKGDVRIVEGERTTTGEVARYFPATQVLTLERSVRVVDTGAGATSTAESARLERASHQISASGDVKTTYVQSKAQPNGALLASSEAIHVTAPVMTADTASNSARYSGGARLWQGANIIQAPVITFDRRRRTLEATGAEGKTISCVFVQTESSGKQTPVEVNAARLTYSDEDRIARFDGGITLHTSEGTIRADRAAVYLQPRGKQSSTNTASQLDRIEATGNIQLQQQGRKGSGAKLTYTAAEGKFVLTGSPGQPPVITDAEHGSVTGESLVFFTRDDKVLVEGANTRAVTHTRIKQ